MNDLSIFRKLHHLCIVVRDLDNAVKYYESVGVGPWMDFPPFDVYELTGYNREAFLQMRYKYANIDNVQIQLCEPGEGDTPQRSFLDTHGEGVFHLGFLVENVDEAEEAGVKSGLQVRMSGRLDGRGSFTYFDTADKGAGVTLEVRAASTHTHKDPND